MPSGKNDYEFIQYYDVNDPEFLSELLKKSTFFEEISSYTETSPTDEYTHNTYYLAEATRWIPLTVQYVCAHCEQINTDYRQFLTAKGKSGSSSSRKAAMSPERKMEARRKLDANVQSVLENFKNRDYQRLAFHFRIQISICRASYSSRKGNNCFSGLQLVYGNEKRLGQKLLGQ